MARIRTVFADKGYDAEHHRDLCRALVPNPASISAANRAGQDWANIAGRSSAQCLSAREQRLALRYDRLGFIIQSLLQAACIFLVAGR